MSMEPKERKKEEYAVVLDFLPNGYPNSNLPSHRKTSIAQAIGKNHFSLLELVPKKEVFCNPGEEVYIGEGKRDKIHHINGKIDSMKLTVTAMQELKYVVKELINKNETKFVDFFNTAGPLSLRMHQLELLPGLGKKHMREILDEREEKPFESLADLKTRVKSIPNPDEVVSKRILKELDGLEKHNLFVR